MTKSDKGYVDIKTVIHEIRQDYLFGFIDEEGKKVFLSLKKLAEKYNVSPNTLQKTYSTPEKWGEERSNIQEKIKKKVENKKTELEAEKIVKLDTKYESYFSELAKETINNMRNKKKKGHLKAIDMKNYSEALLNCYEGEKVAHDESLENSDNSSNGWDALAKAIKEPPDQEIKEKN